MRFDSGFDIGNDPPEREKKPAIGLRRVLSKSVNMGWAVPSGHDWLPSAGDVATRNKALPLLKEKMDYIGSDLYRKRLKGMGEANPEKLAGDRIAALKNTEFYQGAKGGASSTQEKAWANAAAVTIANGADDSTINHELGHVTSSLKPFTSKVNQGGAMFMSPAEAWKIINSDKTLSQGSKQSVFDAYGNDAKFGNFSTDPTARYMQGDEHEFGAGEAKGDLDAMRGLLKKHGYTQNFGDDIDGEVLKKALMDDKIKSNMFIQRLLKRFKPEDIINLNNSIASASGNVTGENSV